MNRYQLNLRKDKLQDKIKHAQSLATNASPDSSIRSHYRGFIRALEGELLEVEVELSTGELR